jgi:hypothetical protein
MQKPPAVGALLHYVQPVAALPEVGRLQCAYKTLQPLCSSSVTAVTAVRLQLQCTQPVAALPEVGRLQCAYKTMQLLSSSSVTLMLS